MLRLMINRFLRHLCLGCEEHSGGEWEASQQRLGPGQSRDVRKSRAEEELALFTVVG